jgi:hypothetical protein
MAKANSTRAISTTSATPGNAPGSIAEDISDSLNPIYALQAMLQGASSLIDDPHEVPCDDVWAVRELIDAAYLKAIEIMRNFDDRHINERIKVLEGGAV